MTLYTLTSVLALGLGFVAVVLGLAINGFLTYKLTSDLLEVSRLRSELKSLDGDVGDLTEQLEHFRNRGARRSKREAAAAGPLQAVPVDRNQLVLEYDRRLNAG